MYNQIVMPEKILKMRERMFEKLSSVENLIELDSMYEKRALKKKNLLSLEADIKIKESEIICNLIGTGKAAIIILDGKEYAAGTVAQIDAVRRFATGDLRKQKAKLEGEIFEIESQIEAYKENSKQDFKIIDALIAIINQETAMINYNSKKS